MCEWDVQGADYTRDAHTTFGLYYNLWTLKNVGQWLEPSRMARTVTGCTLGVAAEIPCLGYEIVSTSSTSTLPRWHNGPHPLTNNGHRSESHPHTNMHTQMHIKQDLQKHVCWVWDKTHTQAHNLGQQDPHKAWSLVWGRNTYKHTKSASKTRMKHGHWSEIVCNAYTQTHKVSQQDPHKAFLLVWDCNINSQPQPARSAQSMVTGLRLQHIATHKHTKSASKTHTVHGRWYEIDHNVNTRPQPARPAQNMVSGLRSQHIHTNIQTQSARPAQSMVTGLRLQHILTNIQTQPTRLTRRMVTDNATEDVHIAIAVTMASMGATLHHGSDTTI